MDSHLDVLMKSTDKTLRHNSVHFTKAQPFKHLPEDNYVCLSLPHCSFCLNFPLTFLLTDLTEKGQCPPVKKNTSDGLEADLQRVIYTPKSVCAHEPGRQKEVYVKSRGETPIVIYKE